MKITLTTQLALALMLAASPMALAGSTTSGQQQPQTEYNQNQTQSTEQPATGNEPVNGQKTGQEQPADQNGEQTQDQAVDQQDSDQKTTAETKQSQQTEIPGQIVLQSNDTILVSSLIGANVYAPDDDNIGEVDDIIIGLDGTVSGVVVGVGGFLGIGEKPVALEMSAFVPKVSPDGGSVLLYLNASREDLENAPEFKTARQQQLEDDAAKAQQDLQDQTQRNSGTQVPSAQAPQPQQ